MTQTSPQQPNKTTKTPVNLGASKNGASRTNKSITLANNSALAKIMPWWQRQSLRFRTSCVAVALGVIPVVGVGLVLSGTVANNLREQIVAQEKQEIITVSQEIESYINVI